MYQVNAYLDQYDISTSLCKSNGHSLSNASCATGDNSRLATQREKRSNAFCHSVGILIVSVSTVRYFKPRKDLGRGCVYIINPSKYKCAIITPTAYIIPTIYCDVFFQSFPGFHCDAFAAPRAGLPNQANSVADPLPLHCRLLPVVGERPRSRAVIGTVLVTSIYRFVIYLCLSDVSILTDIKTTSKDLNLSLRYRCHIRCHTDLASRHRGNNLQPANSGIQANLRTH